MRLDGFEIKVTIGAEQVSAARDEWLPAGGGGDLRAIWFLERPSPAGGVVTLPLLDAGVILRLRENQDDEDDSTVKLRPCEPSWLSDRWLGAKDDGDWVVKVEQDWAGERHVLAASLVAEQGEGEIAALRDQRRPARALFSGEQERFLDECAPVAVDLDALRPLGPVDARRWKHVEIGPHEVVAEQWQVGDLLFLELSIRAGGRDEAEAARAQRDFERRIRDRGFDLSGARETKTRTVLEYLAGRAP
jgi:hypothetical protein